MNYHSDAELKCNRLEQDGEGSWVCIFGFLQVACFANCKPAVPCSQTVDTLIQRSRVASVFKDNLVPDFVCGCSYFVRLSKNRAKSASGANIRILVAVSANLARTSAVNLLVQQSRILS